MKLSKRLLSGVLVTGMIISVFTGCQSTNETNTSESSKAVDEASTTKSNEKSKPTEISVMLFDRGNVPEGEGTIDENRWTQWIQEQMLEKYNIKVTYFIMPRSEEIAKVPVLMASSTAPDITYHYGGNNIRNWYQSGGIYDLNPYIEKYGQDLVKNLGDDVLLDGQTDAGEQYAIPSKRSTRAKFNVFIRKDWVEKLSLPIPTTIDELYTTLKAFKEEDPGKIGSDKVIPYWPGYMTQYSFLKNTDTTMYTAYYVNHWQFLDPGYKDALKWQNKLYNEGLTDPEYFTDKGNAKKKEAVVTGRLGYFEENVNGNIQVNYGSLTENLQKNIAGADLVSIEPIKNVNDGKVYNPLYPPSGGSSFVPKTAKDPEACVKYMNFLAGEGGYTVYFGLEGEHYKLVDGVPVAIDGDYNAKTKDWINLDLALTYGMSDDLFLKTVAKATPDFEQYVINNYNNAAAGTLLKADHQPYIKEVDDLIPAVKKVHSAYQVKLITCKTEEFESIWNEYWSEMVNAGADKIIQLRKEAYNIK